MPRSARLCSVEVIYLASMSARFDSACRLLIKRKIQLEYIHPRFAQKAKLTRLRMRRDKLLNLLEG